MTNLINVLNNTGDGFCRFALAMLIQSSILIVLLYLIDLLIRKHVRAVFRYCIWMLIFVKLILPPTLCLPTGIGYWYGFDIWPTNKQLSPEIPVKVTAQQADAVASEYSTLHLTPASKVEQPVRTVVPTITDDSTYTPPIRPSELESASVASVNQTITITAQAIIFLIWLVGLLVLSVLLFQRFLFAKNLLTQSDKANSRFNETLQQCCQQVGLRKNIDLRLSKYMLSPAVCGLFSPVILMPASLLENLSKEKLRAVLIHELAHIKRGDLWVNFLQTLLQIVYFYNPLLWFANSIVRGIREKAVDEMVLTKLGDDAKSYSNTLIDIAEIALSRPHFSLRLVGVVESKKALTSRIKHILSRPFPKSSKLGIAGIIAIIVTAAILLPMAKATSNLPDFKAITPPAEYIGHWKGQAKIIVSWTQQKNLPIDIEIHFDGTVEGEIGDAQLVNGKLVKKSLVYTKVFQHETPYRIVGDLQGDIIKIENIQRDSVHISIRVEDGKIDGGLGTSGTKTGNKETMILSATDVSLIRVQASPYKRTTFKDVSLKSGFRTVAEVEGGKNLNEMHSDKSKIEFRIIPQSPFSSDAARGETVKLEPQQIKTYRDQLKQNGPTANADNPFIWLPVKEGAGVIFSGVVEYTTDNGKKYVLACNTKSTAIIADGSWGFDKVYRHHDLQGRDAVMFEFDESGAKLFYQLTKTYHGNTLAIIINGEIYSAPQIMSAVRGEGIITGNFTQQDAEELAVNLQKGMPAVVPKQNGQQPGFDPTIEITVNDAPSVEKDCLIDFDTGKLFSLPENWREVMSKNDGEWVIKNGIDASAATRSNIKGLICNGMIFAIAPGRKSYWDNVKANSLVTSNLWEVGKPGIPAYMTTQGQLPATYMFKTREGRIGILQITGFSDKPRGVNIRYKMVTNYDENETADGRRLTQGEHRSF